MVIAVAKDIPAMPVERWFAILPEAASQVWKQKNKVQQKNTSPWMWTIGFDLNVRAAIGSQ
jgi:hypothetical protein